MINEMWFYWLSVADKLSGAALFVAILSGIAAAAALCCGVATMSINMEFGEDDRDYKAGKRIAKIGVILSVITAVSFLMYAAIPSKEVLIEMKVAKLATAENIDLATEKAKEAIDYIVQKMAELK